MFSFDLLTPPAGLGIERDLPRMEQGGPTLGAVVLPEDETAHRDPSEWWYYKGHLDTASGRRLSFLAVVLRQRVLGVDVVAGITKRIDWQGGARLSPHFVRVQSLAHSYEGSTDPTRIAFRFGAQMPGIGEGPSWSVASEIVGRRDGYRLKIDGEHGLDLRLETHARAALLGERGIVDYGGGETLAYYARPDLTVTGTARVAGRDEAVTGTAWMERQWGAADVRAFTWKYIPVQLDDGRRLIFFRVKHPKALNETTFGARLSRGEVEEFKGLEIVDDEARGFTPPLSRTPYRTHTRIRNFDASGKMDLELTIRPVFEDQLVSTLIPGVPTFWEGACTASGTLDGQAVTGRAMTEISLARPR